MTKQDLLYQELLKRKVFRYKEIEEIAKKIIDLRPIIFRYLYNEYIIKLVKKGKLLHPQRGLYVAVPPTLINDDSFQPDKYLIAAKIQSPYYLGYHTALELYGCAYSSFNKVHIVVPVKSKFRAFEFKGLIYRPVYSLYHSLGIKVRIHKNQKIMVSSPSRTFIDCIDRPDLIGGWEECLKSLDGLYGVNANELRDLLKNIDKDILIRKTGLILELFSENPNYEGLADDLHNFLEKNIGKSPMYIDKGVKSEFVDKWNLYVPFDFKEILKGV